MMSDEQAPTPDEIAEYEAKLAEYVKYQSPHYNTRLSRALEWSATLIFAFIVLAVWFLFHSITFGFLVAIPFAALMVWGLLAIHRWRVRPSHEWLKANAHRFQQERD